MDVISPMICLNRTIGGNNKIFGRQDLGRTTPFVISKIQFDHNEEGAIACESTSFYRTQGLAFEGRGKKN